MLLHKLFISVIYGKAYQSVKPMYKQAVSSIRINRKQAQWLHCIDPRSTSPTLLVMWSYDHTQALDDLDQGLNVGNFENINVLKRYYFDRLYTENKLQIILDVLEMHFIKGDNKKFV